MKHVMTFGTFDILHYGHLRLLDRAKGFGDRLFVGLASDDLVAAGGKPPPFYPWNIRREMLLHTRHVDQVIAHGGAPDSAGPVRLIGAKIAAVTIYEIDHVIMGADWAGAYDFLRPYCEVSYVARTDGISTSEIRAQLQKGR